jgi:hypothetical protein
MMTEPIFYPILSAAPMGILAVIVKTWRWLEDTKGLRVPVVERLLRAPGESARKKKEELDDKVMDTYLWVLGVPLTLLAWYFAATRGVISPSAGFWVTVLLLATVGYGAVLVRLIGLLEMRAQWRLNLSGERAMGEELNRLMADGCQVFHDFPLEKKANIDHIVVAPSGVFAIETKTRRKDLSATREQKAQEVVYDGKRLQFPGQTDKENLILAKNQARNLSDFLGHAVGSAVAVKPMLTFPGWQVTTKGSGEVAVLSPKMIRSAILSDAPAVLSGEQIKQIAQQLEQKCRDVEF